MIVVRLARLVLGAGMSGFGSPSSPQHQSEVCETGSSLTK